MQFPPQDFNESVKKLCDELVPSGVPLIVRCSPAEGGAVNECFPNVEAYSKTHGGSLVHGWALWDWVGEMIEGEFHGVWMSPEGELVDISPRVIPLRWIMFLPDPSTVFEGCQVNNVRIPLTDNDLIRRMIKNANDCFDVMNAGGLKEYTGEVAFNSRDHPREFALHEEKARIEVELAQFLIPRVIPRMMQLSSLHPPNPCQW